MGPSRASPTTAVRARKRGSHVLTLPAIVDRCENLKLHLKSALEQGQEVTIDAGKVSRISAPCLQLIAAALIAFAQSSGPSLRIEPISPPFHAAAERFGFGPLFEHIDALARRRTTRSRSSRRL